MKVELENVLPMEIEKRSFEIITQELGGRKLDQDKELIIKRCIHTSADFEYADSLCFSPDVVEKAMEAIKKGACIVTDTQMAKSGINKRALALCLPGQRLSSHLKALETTQPSAIATAKNATIITTVPYGVVLNASKAFAASVLPLLAKPVTTESKTMPITSSIIAAETMVVPSLVFILPSSFKTETVMATDVAVSIVPINMHL